MSVSEAFRGVVDESVQVNVSQAFNGTTLRSFMPSAAIPDGEVMRRLVQDVDAWAKATKDERNPVVHGGRMGADVQLLPAIAAVTEALVIIHLLHQLRIPKERLIFATVDNSPCRGPPSLPVSNGLRGRRPRSGDTIAD